MGPHNKWRAPRLDFHLRGRRVAVPDWERLGRAEGRPARGPGGPQQRDLVGTADLQSSSSSRAWTSSPTPRRTHMAVMAENTADATAIRPLTIETPEADLEDLRARIAATRWSGGGAGEDLSRGR